MQDAPEIPKYSSANTSESTGEYTGEYIGKYGGQYTGKCYRIPANTSANKITQIRQTCKCAAKQFS